MVDAKNQKGDLQYLYILNNIKLYTLFNKKQTSTCPQILVFSALNFTSDNVRFADSKNVCCVIIFKISNGEKLCGF